MENKHAMILERTYPSGNEVWSCPICGRRIMFSYDPKNDLVVIEQGDFIASHFGGRGGMEINSVETKLEKDKP